MSTIPDAFESKLISDNYDTLDYIGQQIREIRETGKYEYTHIFEFETFEILNGDLIDIGRRVKNQALVNFIKEQLVNKHYDLKLVNDYTLHID